MNTILLKHLFSRTFVLCVLLTFRFQHCASAVLKPLAAMDVDKVWEQESMVGFEPTRTAEADLLAWLRDALAKVDYTETNYEELVTKLGRAAAAEVVLLMVTRRCTTEEAKHLRCPWVVKSWSGIWKLMMTYNDRVAENPSIDDAVLSDSSPPKAEDDEGEGFCTPQGSLETAAAKEVPAPKFFAKHQRRMSLPPRKESPYTPASGLRGRGKPFTTQQQHWKRTKWLNASKSKAPPPQLRQRPKQPLTFKAGVPIRRDQLQHANIDLKSAQHYCKFTKKPMYWCEVEHNQWNLKWLYSVPCGQSPGLCHQHIFLNDDDIVDKGGDHPGWQSRHEVIGDWLSQMGWSRITSSPNQRFQCPRHRDPALKF